MNKEHVEKRSEERYEDKRFEVQLEEDEVEVQLEEDEGSNRRQSWTETSGLQCTCHWELYGDNWSMVYVPLEAGLRQVVYSVRVTGSCVETTGLWSMYHWQ